jgi:dissimilatory sulfite reductase (desulfoviridin) alpha/beta subunit
LGKELDSLYSLEEAFHVVKRSLDHYLEHNRHGERFGEILNRTGTPFLGEGGEPKR